MGSPLPISDGRVRRDPKDGEQTVSSRRNVERTSRSSPCPRRSASSAAAPRPTMTTKIAETTLWQRTLASLIRSGLFQRAEVVEVRGLHAVVGVYGDGSHSAPLAKYA